MYPSSLVQIKVSTFQVFNCPVSYPIHFTLELFPKQSQQSFISLICKKQAKKRTFADDLQDKHKKTTVYYGTSRTLSSQL